MNGSCPSDSSETAYEDGLQIPEAHLPRSTLEEWAPHALVKV